jgi:hypothetical protein
MLRRRDDQQEIARRQIGEHAVARIVGESGTPAGTPNSRAVR